MNASKIFYIEKSSYNAMGSLQDMHMADIHMGKEQPSIRQ
jgi:hypothetical protein